MSGKAKAALVVGALAVGVALYYAAQSTSKPSTTSVPNTTTAAQTRTPAQTTPAPSPTIAVHEPGVLGSSSAVGCSDHLWHHVYNPSRLEIENDCVTVTGVIVDATAGKRTDGVRKEQDGDTHGWIKLDLPFESLLNSGNQSDEGGNLVFEVVCYWYPSQADAKPACSTDYANGIVLPPVGTHVAITGTLVKDHNHAQWREIHPVSAIKLPLP